MNTSRQITGIKAIMNIAKPIVVFQLAGHPDVARNPKQALIDLQNSGRALNVTSVTDVNFVKALHNTVGATLSGDLRVFKAGDEYTVTEGHPALTDKNHALYGKVKLGEKLRAEGDGVYVEGFLSIPETDAEKMRGAIAEKTAEFMASLLGITPVGAQPAYSAPATETFVPEGQTEEQELVGAALGKPATEKK